MPRVEHTDEAFKKRVVVVGKPKLTENNINEQYLHDPPKNIDEFDITPKQKWKAKKPRNPIERELRMLKDLDSEGRMKPEDGLAAMVMGDI